MCRVQDQVRQQDLVAALVNEETAWELLLVDMGGLKGRARRHTHGDNKARRETDRGVDAFGGGSLKSFGCEDLRTIASLVRFMSSSLQAV